MVTIRGSSCFSASCGSASRPGRFVRDANVTDLARAHLFGQRFQRLQQRNSGGVITVLITELAKVVSLALRPVQLVEVEVIGIEAFQAGVQRFADVLAIQRRLGRISASLPRTGPATLLARMILSRLPRFCSQLPMYFSVRPGFPDAVAPDTSRRYQSG